MKKASTRRNNKQVGKISPLLIVVGVVVVIVIVVLIASGALKFQGSISRNTNQSSAGQSNEEASVPKNKIYTNTVSGITLEYPENWSMKESPGEGVIVAFGSPKESNGDKFVDNVNLTITDLSSKPNLTLEQLTDLWLKQTGTAPSFEMLERNSISIGGEAANQLVFTYNNEGMAIKGTVVIAMKNNKAYITTYSAEATSYDKFSEIANTIANSLKIN